MGIYLSYVFIQNKNSTKQGNQTSEWYKLPRPYITILLSTKILKIPELIKHEMAKIVQNHFCNKLFPLLSKLFLKTSELSNGTTRSSNSINNTLYIPRYRTKRLQKCIKYQGVKIWNDIPSDIKNKNSRLFKSKLKNYFLNQY